MSLSKWRKLIIFVLICSVLFTNQLVHAQDGPIIWVTTNRDSGAGSLREAMINAQPGDSIKFSEDIFFSESLTRIELDSELPPITLGGITIDASPNRVILDGQQTPDGTVGLRIQSDANVILGLWIINFPLDGIHISDGASKNLIGGSGMGQGNNISGNGKNGILILGKGTDDNIIQGNTIGLDFSGQKSYPNKIHGIDVADGPRRTKIGGLFGPTGNVVSGNESAGILLEDAYETIIQGNIIGANRDITSQIPNATVAIVITRNSSGTVVGSKESKFGNVLSGKTAIHLWDGARSNSIAGNTIGNQNFDEGEIGISIGDKAEQNTIGPNNVISNFSDGILISGPEAKGNTITQNSIFDNNQSSIKIMESAIPGQPPKIEILDATSRFTKGLTTPNAVVEVYSDDDGESRFYEGSTTADSIGEFDFVLPVGEFRGDNITVLSTDSSGTTSGLSKPTPKPSTGAVQALPNIPTPKQVSTDPGVVGTNLFITFLSVLYFGFTTNAFNSLIKKYKPEFSLPTGRYLPKKWIAKIESIGKAELGDTRNMILRFIGIWLMIAIINSFIQSFLDPSLGVFDSGRWKVVLSLLLAGIVMTLLKLIADGFIHKKLGDKPNLRAELRWFGLVVAIASVIFSRSLEFRPGYLLGMMGTLVLLPRIEGTVRSGKRVLAVMGWVLLITFLMWVGSSMLPNSLAWMEALILNLFASAISGILFELIPIGIFDGNSLWLWKRSYWFILFLPVSFLFVHLFLNPNAKAVKALQQNGILTLFIVMFVYGLATLVLWLAYSGKLGSLVQSRLQKTSNK